MVPRLDITGISQGDPHVPRNQSQRVEKQVFLSNAKGQPNIIEFMFPIFVWCHTIMALERQTVM